MDIDFSKLKISDLEDLIELARQERRARYPEITTEVPKFPHVVQNPAWRVEPFEGGVVIKYRDPGLGWRAFSLPPWDRSQLLRALLDQVSQEVNTHIHNLEVKEKKIKKKK